MIEPLIGISPVKDSLTKIEESVGLKDTLFFKSIKEFLAVKQSESQTKTVCKNQKFYDINDLKKLDQLEKRDLYYNGCKLTDAQIKRTYTKLTADEYINERKFYRLLCPSILKNPAIADSMTLQICLKNREIYKEK